MKIDYDTFIKMRALAKKEGVEKITMGYNSELLDLSDKFEKSDRYSLLCKVHDGYCFYWRLDYRADKESPLPFIGVNGQAYKMRKNLTILI